MRRAARCHRPPIGKVHLQVELHSTARHGAGGGTGGSWGTGAGERARRRAAQNTVQVGRAETYGAYSAGPLPANATRKVPSCRGQALATSPDCRSACWSQARLRLPSHLGTPAGALGAGRDAHVGRAAAHCSARCARCACCAALGGCCCRCRRLPLQLLPRLPVQLGGAVGAALAAGYLLGGRERGQRRGQGCSEQAGLSVSPAHRAGEAAQGRRLAPHGWEQGRRGWAAASEEPPPCAGPTKHTWPLHQPSQAPHEPLLRPAARAPAHPPSHPPTCCAAPAAAASTACRSRSSFSRVFQCSLRPGVGEPAGVPAPPLAAAAAAAAFRSRSSLRSNGEGQHAPQGPGAKRGHSRKLSTPSLQAICTQSSAAQSGPGSRRRAAAALTWPRWPSAASCAWRAGTPHCSPRPPRSAPPAQWVQQRRSGR